MIMRKPWIHNSKQRYIGLRSEGPKLQRRRRDKHCNVCPETYRHRYLMMEDSLAVVLSRLTTQVNEAVQDQAKKLLQTWVASEHPDYREHESIWAICAVYIATVHVKYGKGAPVSSGHEAPSSASLPTVFQLLQATNTNIKTFFEYMGKLGNHTSLSDTVNNSVMSLKQKYLITYAIFRKFEKLFKKLFKSPDEVPCSTEGSCDVSCDKRKVCWLLFLLAKGSMLSECSELVLPLHLMLSCVDYMLWKALPFTVREAYSSSRYDSESEEETNERVLEVVCREGGVDAEEEVAMVKRSIFLPFIAAIPEDSTNQDVEGYPKLEYLDSTYRQMYQAAGDIDERCFLTFDPTVTPASAVTTPVPPSPDSTMPTSAFNTPVRRAITTVQALRTLLSGASDTPSQTLLRFFEGCAVNPQRAIEQRVERLKERFVGHYVGEIGVQASELACTRFKLGLRFYYRIMEAMLIQEERRLSTSDFSILLNNDTFHRSLLACSLEVVMVTFGYTASPINPGMSAKSSKLLFPWILDVFDLHSYQFIKVIESFSKNEPRLTEEARRHLQAIETEIVESLAWAVNSPLFDALKAVRGIEVNNSANQSPRHNATSNTTAADMFLSPVRPGHYSTRHRQNEATPPRRQPHPQHDTPTNGHTTPTPSPHPSPRDKDPTTPSSTTTTTTTTPDPPSPAGRGGGGGGTGGAGGERPASSVSLNTFFSKVLQLAYHRLQAMCGLMGIKKDLNVLMWTCLEHCITNKPWLLTGRHLDQILMCCMYAVCKVRDQELKFKAIVDKYRSLPHALTQTYKNVFMGADKESVSIIAFYNEIFIPQTREYIHKFQLSVAPCNLSPVPSRCQSSSRQATPIYQVAGANMYISPMRDSPFRSPRPVSSPSQMTPRTRTLYSFGESLSSERLRQFNEEQARPVGAAAGRHPHHASMRLTLAEDGDSGVPAGSDSVDGADENGHVTRGRPAMRRMLLMHESDTERLRSTRNHVDDSGDHRPKRQKKE